jgi:hypothetical protein
MKQYLQAILEQLDDSFYEREELERTIDELHLDVDYHTVEKQFNKAPSTKLTSQIWDNLDNTDNDVKDEADVKQRLIDYGRDPKNYDAIVEEIKKGIWHPPLIIDFGDDHYYLVAGNTRLMVSKIIGYMPMVKIIEL